MGHSHFMRLEDQLVTVVTTHAKMNSPLIREMKANGAEVWSNIHMRASYNGVKKLLPNSKFKDMRSLYGKYKDQTVFICGSGPSLSKGPTKFPGPTFAINRAISYVNADYWCFSDAKAARLFADHPNAKASEWAFGSAMHVFFKDVAAYLIEANGNPMDHHVEAERPLYWNGATFSWVLHWAVKSGAKRIITVGCEFSLEGYFDGTPILPFENRKHDAPDLGPRIVSETARLRVDDMFGPDKHHWFDPSVEILDASNGYLPVPKTQLEKWL